MKSRRVSVDQATQRSGARWSLRLVLFLAVCVVAIAVTGFIVWRNYFQRSRVADGLHALAVAYRERRPIEARVSGVPYAPFISHRGARESVDQLSSDLAERLLLEAVNEKSNAASRQALGQFRLMSGTPAKAVVEFEEALKLEPENSALHNDLAVALLEMSRNGGQANTLQYLARSFEQVDLALKLNPSNLEAMHNRALVLQQMRVPEQRNAAWREYLAHETDARWIAEAKHKLEAVSGADSQRLTATGVMDSFLAAAAAQDDDRTWRELTSNKEMITGSFIPLELTKSYLSASASENREESKRILNALRYAGRLELERAQDPFVSEIADYYSQSSSQQQKLLEAAHLQLRRGWDSCIKTEYDASIFLDAQKLFRAAKDEWEARICDYWIAYCLSNQDKLGKSTEVLNSLAEFSKERNYKWLLGHATGWLANNNTDLGEYSKSVDIYNEAIKITTESNDLYNQQKFLSQLGNTYLRLGQPERALDYDWRALQLIDFRVNSVRQTWRVYLYTTRALINLQLYEAATQYSHEMLSLALKEINDPAVTHFSYLYLAQIKGGQRQFDEAIKFAEESLTIANTIADRANAHRLTSNSLLQLAHLQRQSGNVSEALKTYNQAIENYAGTETTIYRYDALKGRLLCAAALNDTTTFEANLPAVLDEFERYRLRIVEEQNRNTFFDREQSVYDLAINHAFQKGDYAAALKYSETSRARSLLKSLTDKAPNTAAEPPNAPFDLNGVQRQLPADLQVLEYSVLDDKLVAWLITNTSVTSKATTINASELRTLASDYVARISSGPGDDEQRRTLSQRLYGLLITPFQSQLDRQKALCIVPDKILSYVPFAALISPESQQYLVADFTLLSSPSLNVLLHSTAAGKVHPARAAETLLSIGNPSFDHGEFPELDDLPAAAKEAEEIARYYFRSYKFIGPRAAKRAIEKHLLQANVVHFAGHYVTNQSLPLQSKLVLAKQEGSTDSDLTVGELVGKRLPNVKLVILSSCQTGGKDYYNGEGLTGISRAFLELGIPLVVASHWPVESESTADLMLKFHRYRKELGLTSVAALRKAQLDLANAQDGYFRDPYYWAAFTPFGGYIEY